MSRSPGDRLVTARAAAAVLGVQPETVRRHLRSGEVRGVRIGSGPKARWRIPAEELRRLTTTSTGDPDE